MNRCFVRGGIAVVALGLLLTATGRADEVRTEKYRLRDKAVKSVTSLERIGRRKAWRVTAVVGIASDNNVGHLLTNAAVNSNRRLPDTVMHYGAGLFLIPRIGRWLKTEWSYDYDRYSYARHTTFDYAGHALSGALFPRLGAGWSLDLGGDYNRAGDKNGVIAHDEAGHMGFLWNVRRFHLQTGYEVRRDRVKINSLKDAHSNIGYLSARQRLGGRQLGFASYRYRANAADGPDFSYKAHTGRLSLISHWTPSFKTIVTGGGVFKNYENRDSRFLTVRRDREYSVTVKPALMLLRGLQASASFTYLQNRSNVQIKSFSDQIYTFSLEGSF